LANFHADRGQKHVQDFYTDALMATIKDLPDRFPSVLSRGFRQEAGEYENDDNLLAMYLLYNLGRNGVQVGEASARLEIDRSKPPLPLGLATAAVRTISSARRASPELPAPPTAPLPR